MDYKYIALIGLGLVALLGCKSNEDRGLPFTKSVDRNDMPNPASLYCVERKGRVVLKQTQTGAYGECHLPNGVVMEEWALYRKDHGMDVKKD